MLFFYRPAHDATRCLDRVFNLNRDRKNITISFVVIKILTYPYDKYLVTNTLAQIQQCAGSKLL